MTLKVLFISALFIILEGSLFSQSELKGKFFYNITSDYRRNDSSIIDVDVKCVYFTDSLIFSVTYCSCENSNYYYYNTEESIQKNIQMCIKHFFSLPEIDSVKYRSIVVSNPISEDKTILGFTNSKLSDSTSASFFVYSNQLFEIYDQKIVWENGNSIKYQAENNEFFYPRCFKEFDNRFVRKNIKNNYIQ